MRFINDMMVPVIVAEEEAVAGEVEELIRALRFAKGVGGIARQLGRYTVGVPRSVRTKMVTEGVAEGSRPIIQNLASPMLTASQENWVLVGTAPFVAKFDSAKLTYRAAPSIACSAASPVTRLSAAHSS